MALEFNWGRMQKTPAGALERKEQGVIPDDLIRRFERQAIRDLDAGNAWAELTRDIEESLAELTEGDGREKDKVAREIIKKHQRWLREEKGIEDADSQVAYVLATAIEIKRRKNNAN